MTDENSPVVSMRGLTVRYGRIIAVDNLSLDIPAGCVYALLGRNGAGKTSVIRCLLGQWRPREGETHLFGRCSWSERGSLMARIGVLPEREEIPPAMTADRLGLFFSGLYSCWDAEGFDARLRRFQVPRGRRFGSLSKGQQRQLSLALALATWPELLVLDDPTLGLDAVARRELVEELIGELADRGTTVLVATNDIAGVEGVAERVGILRNGGLIVDEEQEQLKARFRRLRFPAGVSTDSICDELPERSDQGGARRVAGGVETVVDSWTSGLSERAAGVGVLAESLSLEEIFVALCGSENGGSP